MKYTLIFLKFRDEILMLNRKKSPNMGLWNGVGGKIEKEETALSAAIREVEEETGIILDVLTYTGTVSWMSDDETEGMHVYIHEFDKKPKLSTPVSVDEGILDWKKIDWILHPENIGVVENIAYYLPDMLSGVVKEHLFYYDKDDIVNYKSEETVEQKKIV